MEDPKVEELWPKVPDELRSKEVRLPSEFRDIVADRKYENEEIGKIVRCLLMHSDLFMDQKIEPVVYYFRQIENRKAYFRDAVKRGRERRRNAALGSTPVDNSGSAVDNSRLTVKDPGLTVKDSADSRKTETRNPDRLSPVEKTPTIPKEKIPPIVPLKKKPPSFLEKRRLEVQGDLFASLPVAGSQETGTGRPPGHPDVSDVKLTVQDIESDSRGADGAETAMRTTPRASDSRSDAAWIPQKFEIFWARYPRKVAKKDAMKAFAKVIKAQRDVEKFMSTVLASVEWWKSQPGWTKDKGKFIPYPATWLNRGSWEDSVENSSSPGMAEFLSRSEESDEDLIRRMTGG